MELSLQVNSTLLRAIVTQPASENYVYATDFNSLEILKDMLLNQTCRIYVPTPPPPTLPPVKNGDHLNSIVYN